MTNEKTSLAIRTRSDLAKLIDHTALKPETTAEEIVRLCQEARDHNLFAVCVAPSWVRTAREHLDGTAVRTVTVIGFPHGNTLPEVKAFEAEQAIRQGAQELDMVLNIGVLRSGQPDGVVRDIKAVVDVARRTPGTIVQVIIETALLSDEQKVQACRLVQETSADFVKTSTGFSSGGATVSDIRLMKEAVGNRVGIKAAGGIRDLATTLAMIRAGATRLGCSASVSILEEMPK